MVALGIATPLEVERCVLMTEVPYMGTNHRCCYVNSLEGFLRESKSDWIAKMKVSFLSISELPLGESQVRAWRDCFDVLMAQLPELAKTHPNFDIVFEYNR